MLLITKIFSSIVITMSGFKNFKIIQISVYRVLFGCQGSHISSKVLSLKTERGCRYRVRVHDATDHKKISSIVITLSRFKIFKIIQISVYRVRFSENLVSDLANYHNGVPVRHHLFTNEFLIYLSVLSTQPKFNFNPLPVKSGLLVFFFPPGRGLVLGLLIFFLLSFSFSAFASLSSLVLLNSTLYSQNASAHVTYGINSKV